MVLINAWINSCGYHPPPRAIPPGFVFFLQECSTFPTPGIKVSALARGFPGGGGDGNNKN
jgi:hypothetical protein